MGVLTVGGCNVADEVDVVPIVATGAEVVWLEV
jgi:hypothetical protein